MKAPRSPASQTTDDRFSDRVRLRGETLTPALARVVAYIQNNRLEILTKSAIEIGAAIGTSDATVVRAVQALGFDGLRELKEAVSESLGQGATPADNLTRSLADISAGTDAVDQVLLAHQEAMATMASPRTRADIRAAIKILDRAPIVAVFGMGPTASVARYFAVMIGRAGRTPLLLNASGIGLADQLLHLPKAQAILVLAYGTLYREAKVTLDEAQRLRLRIVLITDAINHELAAYAHAVIHIPRGQAGRVALHGATVVCLESIMLGLAAAKSEHSVQTLDRLNDLRSRLRKRLR
jgi:DNA-binding MurR/RpiR family transcriptional regulator